MEEIEKFCNEYGFIIAIIASVLFVLFIIVCICFFITSKSKAEYLRDIENKYRRLDNQHKKLSLEYNNLYSLYKRQEQHLTQLSLYKKANEIVVHSVETENKPTNENNEHKTYKYLRTANNGIFPIVYDTEDKCYFRMWKEHEVAYFEFHGNEQRAIYNFDAVLANTCEYTGMTSTAKKIDNVEPGVLSQDLRIIKQAKIKLIS